MARRGNSTGRGRSSGGGGRNDFERTDRVGELIRQIVADELRRIDDDHLQFVSVTGVDVDRDLFRAHVFLASPNLDPADIEPIHGHSKRLRQAVARQARLRKTPELAFAIDPGLLQGTRVDEILSEQAPVAAATGGAAAADGEDWRSAYNSWAGSPEEE